MEIGVEFDLTSRHVNRAIAALPEELRRRIRKAAGALEAAETTDRR